MTICLRFIPIFLTLSPLIVRAEINTQGGQVELEMVSEVRSIQPGRPFFVGLRIWHALGWHTYWRQPGIVGVPTSLEWKLPAGFEAGELQWPAPERTKMASLTAWGYEREIILLARISPPKDLKPGAEVKLTAKGTWMACAQTCHPGFGDFELSLPVRAAAEPDWEPEWHARFQQTRDDIPRNLEGWVASVAEGAESSEIVLTLHNRGADPLPEAAQLYFFCDDLQVHSDEPQRVVRNADGSVEIHLVRPEFAPKDPAELSGVVFNSAGWDAKPGGRVRRVSARW